MKQIRHSRSLKSYITILITGIISASLILSAALFYGQTAKTLRSTYREQMLQQLNAAMDKLTEQIRLIDSLYTLFMSNNLIYSSLESPSRNTAAVERQMTYLLINNYVWEEQFINSIGIYTVSGTVYQVSANDPETKFPNGTEILQKTDTEYPGLQLVALPPENGSICFIRNIFSSNNGGRIATMVISIDSGIWVKYLAKNLDKGWYISIYDNDIEICSSKEEAPLNGNDDVLIVSKSIPNLNLSANVAAPASEIQTKLNTALRTYLLIILIIIGAVVLSAFALSKAVTIPISQMVAQINRIADGHFDETISSNDVYEEFDYLSTAFNHMLHKVNDYHKDNLEKQLLLKNAEIQALQAQINPHFLFNVLNILAWKAQISGSEELYQMTIAIGELLKSNVLSKSSSFLPLQEELKYVKFYIYLQKMRFEDKIMVSFDIDSDLQKYPVPCFCIQSLVENSFVHGMEPKKGLCRLTVSIRKSGENICISVCDDGIGFREIPDLNQIPVSSQDSHTHIGLRNLDRRLFLLYGEAARLHITSIPNEKTVVAFQIPIRGED